MIRTLGLSIAPLMLSMVGLVLSADTAQAQLFGGRGFGIGIGGGRGGYYGGNYGNYWGSPLGSYGGGYYGSGYGTGGRYWNGGSNYGNSWNSYPSNSGFYSNNYNYSPGVYGANYSYPANNYTGSSPAYYNDTTTSNPIHNDAAMIRVIVPDPQAQVWFDGTATKQQGNDRMFHTPALTPNTNYSYTVRAKWRENGRDMDQTRTVNVTPGQDLLVDFTRPHSTSQQNQPLETRSTTQPQSQTQTQPEPRP